MSGTGRDHGGGLDTAIARFGGTRADWVDLSTGINPVPYPVPDVHNEAWTALPDDAAMARLLAAARAFWDVPTEAEIIAANGASALIAALPAVLTELQTSLPTAGSKTPKAVRIPGPTYNEHAAAFVANGWTVAKDEPAPIHVHVHPNNPDGRIWDTPSDRAFTIIDESFCDVMPDQSHVQAVCRAPCLILKSFGKFWGLAGLRLGFAICPPAIAQKLRDRLGPWAVAGPALEIGAKALEDQNWAETTRLRLTQDAKRLDALVGWPLVGGTDLFRLYEVPDAKALQHKLAEHHIWSRVFPYSSTWIRLGLPAPDAWDRLEAAL